MASLYQRYRPLRFADVVGQDALTKTLQNEVASGQIAHAYLFSGPRAVGKTTTARILARVINCTNRKEDEIEPCNECEACRSILENRTLDVMEIDAASQTGVENVRENIIAASRVANATLRWKVFIIDEVHMLSTHSFNALLKLIEEPPERVMFILATTELHKIPATVASRCQRFHFKKIPLDLIRTRLSWMADQEKKTVTLGVIERVAGLSEGCLRDAESLFGQVLALGDTVSDEMADIVLPRSHQQEAAALVKATLEGNAHTSIEIIDSLVQEGMDLDFFLKEVLEYLRTILLIQEKVPGALELSAEEAQAREHVAGSVHPQQVVALIELFMKAFEQMKWCSLPHLPLEMAVVTGAGMAKNVGATT